MRALPSFYGLSGLHQSYDMAIVTLTSDLGLSDHYVAAVKASILSKAPSATIVDITHQVRSFDINAQAYFVRNVWQQFPIGTVHVLGVAPEYSLRTPHVAVHYMGHYFVSADNGVFSLLFDAEPEDVFEIDLNQGEDWIFPMKGVFATAAAHLANGGPMEFLGKRIPALHRRFTLQPSFEDPLIQGVVIHIDHYGNVISNIDRELFDKARSGRDFSINFKKAGYALTSISNYFSDVMEGERLAMWNSDGLLMIAVHLGSHDRGGSAASLFGFQMNDPIRIEFYGDPHRENDF
jgi:S-adenosyl-L-methionine hydrolase (adenosine-forming)